MPRPEESSRRSRTGSGLRCWSKKPGRATSACLMSPVLLSRPLSLFCLILEAELRYFVRKSSEVATSGPSRETSGTLSVLAHPTNLSFSRSTVNSMKEPTIDCDICGKNGAKIRHMTRSYGKGADLLIIENVPVVVCPHCGESYLTAETLHEIERIKVHRCSLAKPRNVAVASFA